MQWALLLSLLAAVLAVSARQDGHPHGHHRQPQPPQPQLQPPSILSQSAENDLRRTPINLNPYLRRSLLRALYHLEAEYQQQQALEAGRALSGGVPVIGEYHRTAPAVLKDPALRRALLRVLIHLEAEDLDKRAREEAASELNAKERQALRDAQQENNFLRSFMDENFPTDSPPAQQQQQPHAPQQRDIANMAEYIKYANEVSGSAPGSTAAAGTQVNAYAEQPAQQQQQQQQQDQAQYNGHQLPFNHQQQDQYNQNYNAQQQQPADQQQQPADQQQQQPADQQQQQYSQQTDQYNNNNADAELQTALPSQNYDDTRLALNFQTDYTTQDPYLGNHNLNATTEPPSPTTTDYYQTASPTDEYPTTALPTALPTARQVDGFFFQSPDPVADRDNSIGRDGEKGQGQRSVHGGAGANTVPTAETPLDTTAPQADATTPDNAVSTATTAKPAASSTTEDIKIFQAPLLAAFTLHQDAHGTPQRIVPLYRKASAGKPLDEEQELKQQQLLLEEQLRRLQELQAKQQQLLKLQQFLTQEQERQRQLKKAQQLVKAAAAAAAAAATPAPAQQQARATVATPSVADTTFITQPPTTLPTVQPTQVAQSSTPEAAVQIHHSQGDAERQKQIEDYDKQRQLELERARKQTILEALERERQQKLIEAENARQRQLQQFYEEQHRLRLQELERQRLAALDLTFQRSVEFNPQQIAAPAPAPAATPSAPREPSEEQRLTYRSFQQEPPPLPGSFNSNSVFSNNNNALFSPQQQLGFQQGFNSFQQNFPPFQPSQPDQPTIQPAIQVSAQSFAPVAPQQAPPLAPQQPQAANSRPNRHEPFGSTGNFGFNNNFEQSRNLFFGGQQQQQLQLQPHPQRQRGLDGQLQTLLHQSGISAPQEDLNIVSKVLALNPERPDQLVGLF